VSQRRLVASAAFALIAAVGASAHADGGYFSGVKGARASGRGGAFTARADDLSAVMLNPAGLSRLGTSVIQVGNRFSFNERTFKRNPTLDWGAETDVPRYVEFAPVENQAPWQVLDPFIGFGSNFGLKDWGFAFAVFSPAGTAREVYPADGGQRYMMVRRNAQIIDYNLSAAWKYHDVFGVGATLQWIAVPTLEYGLIIDGETGRAAGPVTSSLDIRATIKGSDLFTLNAIVGAWVRPSDNLELGFSAQVLPSEIKAKGKLGVALVKPSPTVTGITLNREGTPADDVTLSLPLPMTFRLGARYRHLEDGEELFDIELDGVYETWSAVDRFQLDSNNLTADYRQQLVPVGVINVDKQWRNTIGLHLGGDYALLPKLATVRAGFYYESPVAPAAYSNIDFSDGPQLGGALGASLFLGKLEIALTTEYRAQTTVHVPEKDARVYQAKPGSSCAAPYTDPGDCSEVYSGQPGPPINGGTYGAYSLVASLEGTYRF
jgi:long-subunit fatty acid transport protein